MNHIIETERMILRPLTLADAETAYNGWVGDTEVAEWVSWLPLHSLEETQKWLREIEWKQDANDGIAGNDNYIWGFVLKESGELFGSGGLIWEDDWNLYQVGYNIMKKHWNRGFTTEAMAAILRFTADKLKIKRVLGGHAKCNPASGRVLEKLGFVYQKDSVQPHVDGKRVFDSKDYLLDLPSDRKAAVYELFAALGTEYEVVEHPPMFSQVDNEKRRLNIGAVIFKNLFLHNAEKSRHYLLSIPLTKRANLVKVREILGESRLSFGEEDALLEKLNIRPGSVSFLNVIGKPDTDVTILIDNEIFQYNRFGVHPNDNTATIIFAPQEIPKIFDHIGVKYRFVEI
jgi:ribosomal-protein-alanine N-acetyltransferase